MSSPTKSHPVQPNRRYFVPDLSPLDRPRLKSIKPRAVFVAESPHINEIEPDEEDARRPLCGAAGRQWWSMLSELLEKNPDSDVSLERLTDFCRRHQVAVINAVQYPLDPKIIRKFPDADPILTLGFAKTTGEKSFKKKKLSPEMQARLESLRTRLQSPALKDTPIYCLGNDAEWFVTQALGKEEAAKRVRARIPHPSAWWRQSDLFRRIAREKLSEIFKGWKA